MGAAHVRTPSGTKTEVGVFELRCKHRKNGLFCSVIRERIRRLPEDAFAFDPALATADLNFKMSGLVNHVSWTDAEPRGGYYTSECSAAADPNGAGYERHSQAQGTVFGHRVETNNEHEWAGLFVGVETHSCDQLFTSLD